MDSERKKKKRRINCLMVLTSPKSPQTAEKSEKARERESSSGDTTQRRRREEREERDLSKAECRFAPPKKTKNKGRRVFLRSLCSPPKKNKKKTIRYNLSIFSIFYIVVLARVRCYYKRKRMIANALRREARKALTNAARNNGGQMVRPFFFFFSLPCFVFLCISWHSR